MKLMQMDIKISPERSWMSRPESHISLGDRLNNEEEPVSPVELMVLREKKGLPIAFKIIWQLGIRFLFLKW